MSKRCALMMAGGTGGHIFPGLAVAKTLIEQGWNVVWLGTPGSMEARIVPAHGIEFQTIEFGGVRGKGVARWLALPWRLGRAWMQARRVVKQVNAQVAIGMGGYVTVPGALAARSLGVPIVLHEQNAIAGMANRYLARMAALSFSAFPNALEGAQWVGNPLRSEFCRQDLPQQRYAQRTGPLRILVVGGSLGAQALNQMVPQALALLPQSERPSVTHQSGEKHVAALMQAYEQAGVQAECVAFIDNMAQRMADADLVICRSGASTVTEMAAVGVAALMVPFPHAVDDHQTANARFLADQQAGWVTQQTVWTARWLADWIRGKDRNALALAAQKAHALKQCEAAQAVAQACAEVVS
ncbi:MAG: hypothetical protein RLZZ397_1319 [Pseudomonadota bacterium]